MLDHAKEKNIYIDPSTLTDKQKKDAKFMESINTELTAEVVAKAVKSLVSTLSVKIRLVLLASCRRRRAIWISRFRTNQAGSTICCMRLRICPKAR